MVANTLKEHRWFFNCKCTSEDWHSTHHHARSLTKLFKIAYKKLKSSLYYDKTQSIVRDELVRFEAEKKNIDRFLEKLANDFFNPETRSVLFDEILESVSFYVFPKNMVQVESEMVKNYSEEYIDIEDIQYFIDMDIRGHILGVLWLLTIGYRVDKNIYVNSYGNRIREKLINELNNKPTYSPYLFEPYFQQYESWRDKAMDTAMQHLHSEQDVVVMTLDFKRFYYSVDITEELLEQIYKDNVQEEEGQEYKALNEFIYRVIDTYSAKIRESQGLNILPIGFLPSNVLANYALNNFDKAILDGWNPVYYGRYVDDIIIVDKIEPNSELSKKAHRRELEKQDIVSYFLEQCTGWNGLHGIKCDNKKNYALFQKVINNEDTEGKNGGEEKYVLNKRYNPLMNDRSRIIIQNKKVKVFYFKTGESDALLTCFRDSISKNKSEFRHMPEDELVFQKDDYSSIYDLQNEETINKFRGIKGISVDKFELSKLLGKHLRICGMINDENETGFERQILKIMNAHIIIENYNSWEKIIEVLAINESWDTLENLIDKILNAIESLAYQKDDKILKRMVRTMRHYLFSCISRALALVWGNEVNDLLEKLCEKNIRNQKDLQNNINALLKQRIGYCRTRMIDKSVMPIFTDMLMLDSIFAKDETQNLTNFEQMLSYCKDEWMSEYVYYPYLVTMYDFSIISCVKQLKNNREPFNDLSTMVNNQIDNYVQCNYGLRMNSKKNNINEYIKVNDITITTNMSKQMKTYLVRVGNEERTKLRLAIANVRIDHNNFEKVVKGQPNRTYSRYKNLSKIINEALDEKAHMLIMPEAYLPFEWLTTVARTCSRNNLAVVTGIEHIKIDNRIFNLTAIILPFDDSIDKNAFIAFHLKTHYAPAEKQEINGYRCNEIQGSHYELYNWYGCYFPVYCCYELTSIIERSLFQSYADFLVAIEWNKDINYYSNILESLSRDIHCYCVQVNSSDYGDSRITRPSRTEEKDIVRTKGGKNSTILVDEIDIAGLREFQLKEYNLQHHDFRYKPTPPGFQPDIVLKKIKSENIV